MVEAVAFDVRVLGRMTPEELCARYAEKVARFASMAAGADADADDIAQDALLKAIRALHTYDPARGSYDAWLWRIVVNTARDATRRARVRALVQERLGRDLPATNVEDSAIDRASAAEVYAAIAGLAPRDRELLALRFGSDLTTAEVGTLVGLSAESARRAIGRALERARAQMPGGVL
jgi:RNA polymerase sigma-70 factor (ECF subfamily)